MRKGLRKLFLNDDDVEGASNHGDSNDVYDDSDDGNDDDDDMGIMTITM